MTNPAKVKQSIEVELGTVYLRRDEYIQIECYRVDDLDYRRFTTLEVWLDENNKLHISCNDPHEIKIEQFDKD